MEGKQYLEHAEFSETDLYQLHQWVLWADDRGLESAEWLMNAELRKMFPGVEVQVPSSFVDLKPKTMDEADLLGPLVGPLLEAFFGT